jgi:carboxylesterase
MAGLCEGLAARGLTVCAPRLPGHGTNGRDFMQSGWRDWLREATDAMLNLRSRCDTVHVVGYSMGGILAVLLASRFAVGRMVLLAPALRARNPLLPITPLLALFIRRVPWPLREPSVPFDRDAEVLAREYWKWRYPAQAASLLRLQRMAVRRLRRVTADTLTIIGSSDQAVPQSVLPLIERRIGARKKGHVVVAGATHLLLTGAQGGKVIEQTVSWLTEPGAPATVRT